jgi:hypothetical protein
MQVKVPVGEDTRQSEGHGARLSQTGYRRCDALPVRRPRNGSAGRAAPRASSVYAELRNHGPAARVALANGTDAWLVTGRGSVRCLPADLRFSNVPRPRARRPKADSAAERARA